MRERTLTTIFKFRIPQQVSILVYKKEPRFSLIGLNDRAGEGFSWKAHYSSLSEAENRTFGKQKPVKNRKRILDSSRSPTKRTEGRKVADNWAHYDEGLFQIPDQRSQECASILHPSPWRFKNPSPPDLAWAPYWASASKRGV